MKLHGISYFYCSSIALLVSQQLPLLLSAFQLRFAVTHGFNSACSRVDRTRCHPVRRRVSRSSTTVVVRLSEDDDEEEDEDAVATGVAATNVLGTQLIPCCTNVRNTGVGTGFYRNGYCATGEQDLGRHTVCVQVTDEFLEFSKSVGNDLSTPMPQYMFPGLKQDDIWCLCAQRWVQALQNGKAPKLYLRATHEKTLSYVPFDMLRRYALDQEEADMALDDLNEQREKLKKLL